MSVHWLFNLSVAFIAETPLNFEEVSVDFKVHKHAESAYLYLLESLLVKQFLMWVFENERPRLNWIETWRREEPMRRCDSCEIPSVIPLTVLSQVIRSFQDLQYIRGNTDQTQLLVDAQRPSPQLSSVGLKPFPNRHHIYACTQYRFPIPSILLSQTTYNATSYATLRTLLASLTHVSVLSLQRNYSICNNGAIFSFRCPSAVKVPKIHSVISPVSQLEATARMRASHV